MKPAKTDREARYARWVTDNVEKVLKLSNVHTVVMTNSPFDPEEHELWMKKTPVDPRLKGVLRLDPLVKMLVAGEDDVHSVLDEERLEDLLQVLVRAVLLTR